MKLKNHTESRGEYNEEYDSFFNPEEDRWLEEKCEDINCTFCKYRPNKPSECNTQNNNQRKKDKDDGSNDTLSDNPKHLQRKNNKDEHMSAKVDKYVDNPQDDPGEANVADNGDTGDGTFPVDLNLFEKAGDLVIKEDKKLLEELHKR